ncbi:MAG TPA: hypothetical protein VK498_13030 [Ferruginibacter sp.]|nr:hypothetical protein [Ferruginibacter sp.]
MTIHSPLMQKFVPFLFSLCFVYNLSAQNFTGQWKGEFYDRSTKFIGWGGDKCDYVLDLECNGKVVKGYSYTYFTEDGKRFYTICRLEGFIDTKKKYVEVVEKERTKTNVPAEIKNCFQVHKLNYVKLDGEETLEGSWIPAPNQEGSCGYGVTTLTRRILKNSFPNFNSSLTKTLRVNPSTKKLPDLKDKNRSYTTTTKIPVKKQVIISPKKDTVTKTEDVVKEQVTKPVQKKSIPILAYYEKRNTNILKTIEVENDVIKVDLYDNGEIDGDSISLFFNGKLLASGKRLSDKPLSFTIPTDDLDDVNELVMYAENLGSIPPNTALMIVTDGTRRYEVRITSDLKKSGTIRFVRKER